MTPAVRLQGAVLVPFSNPGLPINCVAEAELIVRLMLVVCVNVPDVPVIVIVLVPVVAVLLAVNVKTLVDVVGLTPNEAVTPLGNAEFDRLTEPVNPFRSVTLIVLVPLLPCFTVKLEGEAESEKSACAGAVTVRVTEVVCVSEPDVPVIVMVEVPMVAVELAVSVNTLLDVAGFVPNPAVTPAGKPEAERVTLPVNPPDGVMVMVLLPLVPWVTLRLLGEAESEKFGLDAAGGRTQLFAELENSNCTV